MNDLGKLKLKAIIVTNTSLRKMPTMKPAYYDPNIAGEGYPFDSLQENLLHIGEPVLISHYTKDGNFAFVETNSMSFGFVRTKDIALVDDQMESALMRANYIMVIEDDLHLYSPFHTYVQTVSLGTLLPINKENNIMIPFKTTNGFARLRAIYAYKSKIINKPLRFDSINVGKIINNLINKPYGWGGYLENRDCAQLVKDYFAVFGTHINAFLENQVKVEKVVSLEDLNKEKK